ncbi:MAG: RNA polymerase factor sigma-54 [Ferruginibacter sp.]
MLKQAQLQKQTMKILPQIVQMLGIYHLNTLDLEQRIKDEVDENPLLETAADDDMKIEAADASDPPQEFQNWDEYGYDDNPNYMLENQSYIHSNAINLPIKDVVDFRTTLKQQLLNLNLNETEKNIAVFILDCISDNGYLERSVGEVADDFSFMNKTYVEETLVESVLYKIQDLEPIGIACRNIQEFLLKQLQKQKASPIVRKSTQLIRDHYQQLQKRQFDKICCALEINEEELSIVLKWIAKLQLKPLNISLENQTVKETIIPDFILMVDGEAVTVELYKQKSNTLFINESLAKSVEQSSFKTSHEKAAAVYLKNKLSSAQWFIEAIRQREENMIHIMKAIIKKQKNYFLSGDPSTIQPMILKNIAEEVGLDISTVSRVTCNKYIDTPFGMILLKNLFSEGIINEEGVSVSNKVVQVKLKEIIAAEDRNHPYNDKQLVSMLAKNGIKIARRTIAKYRDIMNIPVGEMRRIWSMAI